MKSRLFALGLCATLMSCSQIRALIPPDIPKPPEVESSVWLSQNWTDEERFWFHHTGQGTATLKLPFDWFVALEQPHLKLFGKPGLLADPDYLAQFGFIPSPKSLEQSNATKLGYPAGRNYVQTGERMEADWAASNEKELPVGIVRLASPADPVTGAPMSDRVGFSCAACHTGQLVHGGRRILIDGGSAFTDLGRFRQVMGLAVAYTRLVPGRFNRFADRVLGENASDEERKALRDQAELAFEQGRKDKAIRVEIWKNDDRNGSRYDPSYKEGFTRLDALNRIGNIVFYEQLRNPTDLDDRDPSIEHNLRPHNAPVNPPPIFYSSWFDWVQYDASIMQPMTRNAGEALGVGALVNLRVPGEDLYRSSVDVDAISKLESLLAGESPFESGTPSFRGLQAPRWPDDFLPPIDPVMHAKGARLYEEICQHCHLPPTSTRAFWEIGSGNRRSHWTEPDQAGRRYLKLLSFDVGTDKRQVEVLTQRDVNLPEYLQINPGSLNRGDAFTKCPPSRQPDKVVTNTGFAWALGAVVEKVVTKRYDDEEVRQSDRARLNGYRPNCLKADGRYKARPLSGIWATAPFLHNGSVPNLDQLLRSRDSRSNEPFYLGRPEFDSVNVGYVVERRPFKGASKIDPTRDGDLNEGHYFEGDRADLRRGIVGRALLDKERVALIEFLKDMDRAPISN